MALRVTITEAGEVQTADWTAPQGHPKAGKLFRFSDQWAKGRTLEGLEYDLKIRKADKARVFLGDVVDLVDVKLDSNARGTFHTVTAWSLVSRGGGPAGPQVAGGAQPAMPRPAPTAVQERRSGLSTADGVDIWLSAFKGLLKGIRAANVDDTLGVPAATSGASTLTIAATHTTEITRPLDLAAKQSLSASGPALNDDDYPPPPEDDGGVPF